MCGQARAATCKTAAKPARFFLFAFCLSIVVSKRTKKKQNTPRGNRAKVKRQSSKKSAKNRPYTSKNRRKFGCGCLRALRGVPSRSGVARKRAWDGLWTPSWAVLAAKLAVLAAMLAVLDAKLAARDGPNDARSHLRALFERVRTLEQHSFRFVVVFLHVSVDTRQL